MPRNKGQSYCLENEALSSVTLANIPVNQAGVSHDLEEPDRVLSLTVLWKISCFQWLNGLEILSQRQALIPVTLPKFFLPEALTSPKHRLRARSMVFRLARVMTS